MMTDDKFDAQLTHIEEQREAKQEAVDGWYEQSLGKLFARSGWTQQRIAEKVGTTQGRVSHLLCFGRFLEFITTCNK